MVMPHCGDNVCGVLMERRNVVEITDFLPKPKVKALRFTVHISYFLQKCKKAKLPKDDLLKLKNDITTILRPHKRAIYCSKHKFHLICDVIDIFGFEYS